MFARLLNMPKNSFLLFGPRGTGKSTWIQQNLPNAPTYDLLDTREALRLSKNPEVLFQEVQSFTKGSWVVIDEIQKVPALLNEVHRLIEKRHLNFVPCGSSARQLRKKGTNLLAGRALMTQFFPLVSAELNFEFDVEKRLIHGNLPLAVTSQDPVSYLMTYAQTYLQEEIRAEALTQNIGNFSRFLEIAARQNGQVTNVSGIARDASVERKTVQNYFDILVDTLIGNWLYPWKLKKATKQVSHPKFYFFDSGVVRALSGRLPYPPTQEESGPLFETMILHEIRAYISYSKLHYQLHYWRNYDKAEVDILCETVKGFVAIEIKVSTTWQRKYNRGLKRVQKELRPHSVKCLGIYRGYRTALVDEIQIFPVVDFLKELWNGQIISEKH